MKLLIILAILCAFALMVVAVEEQKPSSQALAPQQLADNEHVRVNRAARRKGNKKSGRAAARKTGRKTKKTSRKGRSKFNNKLFNLSRKNFLRGRSFN